MTKLSPIFDLAKRPFVLLSALGLVAVILVWVLLFFVPQSHKLTSLESKKTALQQALVQDNARLLRVRSESHHVGQIETLYKQLKGYAPQTGDLYTYIQTLSGAGKAAGVSITTLQASPLQSVTGSPYSAIPIDAEVKGTYDHMLSFIKAVYALPRLTDINSISLSGGGPGTNRSTTLSATMDLVIFTSQKGSTPG